MTNLQVLPVARPADFARILMALMVGGAAPSDIASGFATDLPPAFAQPKHAAPLDPTITELVVARLVQLHLLDRASDAQDATKAAMAIKGFQAGVGLKPTGVLDRKTLAMFAL